MNSKRILGLGLLVVLSACKGSCSCGTDDGDDGVGGSGTGGTDTVTVGNTVTGTGTGGTGDGGAGGGDATTVGTGGEGGGPAPIVDPLVRFLNVATNVDDLNFCLLDDDGEVLGEVELTAPDVSAYTDVNVGNYDVVVVPGGAACDDADGVRFTGLPLADGGIYSLALVGDADGLSLETYEDDLTLPAAGSTRLRLVHAAEGAPAVDVGVYEGDQFIPFFTNASFPNDAGYTADLPAFAPSTLVARAAGTETDLLSVPDVEGTDGEIVNAYAWGNPTDGVDVFIFNDGAVD